MDNIVGVPKMKHTHKENTLKTYTTKYICTKNTGTHIEFLENNQWETKI